MDFFNPYNILKIEYITIDIIHLITHINQNVYITEEVFIVVEILKEYQYI